MTAWQHDAASTRKLTMRREMPRPLFARKKWRAVTEVTETNIKSRRVSELYTAKKEEIGCVLVQ